MLTIFCEIIVGRFSPGRGPLPSGKNILITNDCISIYPFVLPFLFCLHCQLLLPRKSTQSLYNRLDLLLCHCNSCRHNSRSIVYYLADLFQIYASSHQLFSSADTCTLCIPSGHTKELWPTCLFTLCTDSLEQSF